MDGALAWISQIAQWVGQFIPQWRTLEPTQAGIKVVGGRVRWWRKDLPVIVVQHDGIVCWWPAVTHITIYPVARQANDLRAQTLVTSDGRTFTVAGMIVYEIKDVVKIVAHTFDPDDTIRDIALTAIHDACIQHSGDSLMAGARSGSLDREMRAEAKKYLEPYGVNVLKLTLTDLAPCRVYRLVNSAPTERGVA
jgi:regulator of protease activity HflC (stomatin/prohibitin superfamily)